MNHIYHRFFAQINVIAQYLNYMFPSKIVGDTLENLAERNHFAVLKALESNVQRVEGQYGMLPGIAPSQNSAVTGDATANRPEIGSGADGSGGGGGGGGVSEVGEMVATAFVGEVWGY